MKGGHNDGGDGRTRWTSSIGSPAWFVFGITVVLVASCANQGGSGSGTPSGAPGVVAQTQASAQACALATTDGNTFVLVRGASADDDCRLLLTDLASSTVQTWQVSRAQFPPGAANSLSCDLNATSGNRVDVWGNSLQMVGASICSELQTGVVPAPVVTTAGPSPLPTFDLSATPPSNAACVLRSPDDYLVAVVGLSLSGCDTARRALGSGWVSGEVPSLDAEVCVAGDVSVWSLGGTLGGGYAPKVCATLGAQDHP